MKFSKRVGDLNFSNFVEGIFPDKVKVLPQFSASVYSLTKCCRNLVRVFAA